MAHTPPTRHSPQQTSSTSSSVNVKFLEQQIYGYPRLLSSIRGFEDGSVVGHDSREEHLGDKVMIVLAHKANFYLETLAQEPD